MYQETCGELYNISVVYGPHINITIYVQEQHCGTSIKICKHIVE